MTVLAVKNWKDNGAMIADVAQLGYITGTVLDVTYGKGTFWKYWQPETLITHDLAIDGVDFRKLPEEDGSIDCVVLDPPYKLNGTPALGEFDERYGIDVPMTWQQRHTMIKYGIEEAERVLREKGHLLLKCQDQVCSGQVRWQTYEFTHKATRLGFRLVDRFDMLGKARPQPKGRRQVHAQGRPSTLLVFKLDQKATGIY